MVAVRFGLAVQETSTTEGNFVLQTIGNPLSVTVSEGTTFSVRRVPARNQWVSADWCRPLVSHVFSQELT